jgi:hypothetical protein
MAPRVLLFLLLWSTAAHAALPDRPFLQDVAVRIQPSAELTNAVLRKLCVDKDDVPYVLTDKGVARVYDTELALDRSFRPLAGRVARDITLSPDGILYYLFDELWLSNGESGQPLGHLPRSEFNSMAVAAGGRVLLRSPSGLALVRDSELQRLSAENVRGQVLADGKEFFVVTDGQVYRLFGNDTFQRLPIHDATTLARRGNELLVGTTNGYYALNLETGGVTTPLQRALPVTDIRRIVPVADGLWFGTSRGAFLLRQAMGGTDGNEPALPNGPHGIRYYASKRWLIDDDVVDLAVDSQGSLWVLTRTGLNKIEFRPMTLAQKAEYFDRKIRSRHIRFGLAGERRLLNAGGIASGEIIDTDNDGGWSSYYLASQGFRYRATGSQQARANAWEVFAALERLQSINPIPGFSARTFERAGFKYSDPDRWRDVPGGDWEWKGHTSSDEIASQTFAHAVMWECVADSEPERQRVATNYTRMVDHIIAHNWYLVDIDGKPTLWGRWNPEYVNWYPFTVFDRRLNSSEITASLQLAYKMTGRDQYRQLALQLFEQHGYLTNILSSMKLLRETRGYVHLGNEMGDEWNHSDDELALVTYWVLYRFAFDESLRKRYGAAIKDHWDLERAEQFPMWNFIYSGCGGGSACDPGETVWTLHCYPLDTVTWRIENSHRKDLTHLPTNFMRREMQERIPPGEHQITRCNTQPFILDGGDGGHIEFPGDEFLVGYWLGRYLELIAPASR